MELIKKPKSKFIRVKCSQCKNEQTVFNKPATEVKCLVCAKVLMKSTGGKGKAESKVVQVFE
ncbi:MAG: 30S ribosomal protein S27e [Candidatus Altiarchaeota archaeon]|nr:30S ribosomal protein S27e [Candidatus Altiarchaeota archaeon]